MYMHTYVHTTLYIHVYVCVNVHNICMYVYVLSRVHNIHREGEYPTLYCPFKTQCIVLYVCMHVLYDWKIWQGILIKWFDILHTKGQIISININFSDNTFLLSCYHMWSSVPPTNSIQISFQTWHIITQHGEYTPYVLSLHQITLNSTNSAV